MSKHVRHIAARRPPHKTTTFHVSLVGRGDLRGEIYRQIRRAILDGRLKAGDRLPATRELARSLAVSRSTVTVAYERLRGEGIAKSRAGAATFVSDQIVRSRRKLPHSEPASLLQPRAVWDSVSALVAFDSSAKFDFRVGIPDATLFPHLVWRRAVARALRWSEKAEAFYEPSAGLLALRKAIADHIAVSRSVMALPEDLIITNGTQQALDIVARVLIEPGHVIAMEDPGYTPALQLFRSLRARVVGVPVDGEGLLVDQLPSNARAVYVTPSHQFPLGTAMSLARRQALLAWAERHEAAIIEDDYDSEFRFGGRPLEPLQTLDSSGRVIYVGTFSKTMLPMLRLGFLVLPPPLRLAATKAKFVSDWHSSSLAQPAMARFIADGSFARHILKVGKVYKERHAVVTATLERDFAEHLQLVPSSTGLHIAALSRSASLERIASIARHAAGLGVAVQQLSNFAVSLRQRSGITIGYGSIATSKIAEGLRRLHKCFLA
jgi:GntR family transcriptional regulator / MocR family aminotransferase